MGDDRHVPASFSVTSGNERSTCTSCRPGYTMFNYQNNKAGGSMNSHCQFDFAFRAFEQDNYKGRARSIFRNQNTGRFWFMYLKSAIVNPGWCMRMAEHNGPRGRKWA